MPSSEYYGLTEYGRPWIQIHIRMNLTCMDWPVESCPRRERVLFITPNGDFSFFSLRESVGLELILRFRERNWLLLASRVHIYDR